MHDHVRSVYLHGYEASADNGHRWDDYNPNLSLPSKLTEVTSLAPMWGPSCGVVPLWGAWGKLVACVTGEVIPSNGQSADDSYRSSCRTNSGGGYCCSDSTDSRHDLSFRPDIDQRITSIDARVSGNEYGVSGAGYRSHRHISDRNLSQR